MKKRWIIADAAEDCCSLAENWGVPSLVAQLLINRGLRAISNVQDFLAPQLKNLLPPDQLPGCRKAADQIARGVRDGKRIVLYGDYDVDGVTGVAILWHVLRLAGANVHCYVPHRIEEGYGLNLPALRQLIHEGAQIIVSVDCGITAVDIAQELGNKVELIITDHHTPAAKLPACTIVHPSACGSYANPELCGAGVAFKLAWALAQEFSRSEKVTPEFRELLSELVSLAALGTIADVVSLTGENRVIARHGLRALVQSKLPGVQALIVVAGLTGEKIEAYDVGFKLAPRLNAAGRMGHAQLTVELLTSADAVRAREIALYLDDHNRSRQAIERKVLKNAEELIEKDRLASDARRAIVLASSEWHAGVIGIVAARIVDRYHRPAVLIALGENEGQGSGRSIQHFDLAGALSACAAHLISHGGHKMAAGLKIARDRLEVFQEAFVHHANNGLTGDDLVPRLRLDAVTSIDSLTLPTADAILGLGPFGQGNARPRFATDWIELAAEPRCVGSSQKHLQASFRQNGACISAIGFDLSCHMEDLKQHRRCKVAFEPLINNFNGRRSVEMQVLDFQFPESSRAA